MLSMKNFPRNKPAPDHTRSKWQLRTIQCMRPDIRGSNRRVNGLALTIRAPSNSGRRPAQTKIWPASPAGHIRTLMSICYCGVVVDPIPLDGDVLDGGGVVLDGVWLEFVSVDVPVVDVPVLLPLLP